ncbi:MAG: hypothetical protein MK102_03240 [Fuerstiella sp.]|nr:hypothetical protein [Fuerstiella sp.]
MPADSISTVNQTIPRLILLASAGAIIGGILSGTPLQSANDRSRWATVWSLIHRRTWQIDEIDQDPRWSTIDKVRHRTDDGAPFHFYSSKPPLLSSIAAGVYGIQRRILGVDLKRDTLPVTRFTLLLINGLPMMLALWMFQRLLLRLNLSLTTQCFVLLVAGFGSMVNPYLSTLNNHTPAVVSLLICLVTIVRIQQQPQQFRSCDFAITGLTAALLSCFELPAALFGITAFFWMLKNDVRLTFRWFVPAALLPLSAHFVTNWMVTGGILPFYAFFGTDKYVYVHLGIPSYWSHPQGLDSNAESMLTYLFHCVVGHHGLLSHTPVFLLSVWGWCRIRRVKNHKGLPGVMLVGMITSGLVLGFYLTRTQNYNYGGNSVALRWMLWLTPFWWFAMLEPVERLMTSGRGRMIGGTLLLVSVATATVSLPDPWRPSWIYRSMFQAGWIDYRTPVVPFEVPRNSVFTSWPQAPGTFGVWKLDGADHSMKLVSRGHRSLNGHRVCEVEVTFSEDYHDVNRIVRFCVLLDEFETGKPVADWLRVLNGTTELEKPQDWLTQLIQGLPHPRPYAAAGVRWYQETPDSTGYRCERAASRVSIEDQHLGKCWHRCDVWYCDDVPFGVLRWKQTVTQKSSRDVVQVQVWSILHPR